VQPAWRDERVMRAGRGKRGRRTAVEAEVAEPTDTRPRVPSYVIIFTEAEKETELRGQVFRGGHFDGMDFSRADLSFARFQDVTLTNCNFTQANLRGVLFVRCDLRWSTLDRIRLGKNRFELAFFAGCTGLTAQQRRYIDRHGGTFTLDAPRGGA